MSVTMAEQAVEHLHLNDNFMAMMAFTVRENGNKRGGCIEYLKREGPKNEQPANRQRISINIVTNLTQPKEREGS